jgi:predicted Zn-dependent protease
MRNLLIFAAVGAVCLPALANDSLVQGRDYYSLQIASGKSVQVLKAIYQSYVHLPRVRIEKRGNLFVLRAGFWDTEKAAKTGLDQAHVDAKLVRLAVYRPQTIVHSNWQEAPPIADSLKVSGQVTESKNERVQAPPDRMSVPDAFLAPPARGAPASTSRTAANPSASHETLLPFNQQDFALAFDVLVGAGDLPHAFAVAQKAVQSVPQDGDWRRKLARVSEWTQQPIVAVEQWMALFQQGDRSPETVAAVIRLAPLVDKPMLAVQAWTAHAEKSRMTDTQWHDIFVLYENASEPIQGSHFFEALFKSKKYPLLLEYAAQLAENAGDDERALTLLQQRAKLEPFSVNIVLRAVVNLVRRDKMPQALALLRTYEHQVPAASFEYWRLLSQIAWDSGHFETATGAYQRFAVLPQATSADWSRLIFLVRQKHPAQAAQLSLDAYRRFGAMDQLLLGLGIFAEQGDFAAQERVFKSLGTKDLEKAEQHLRFLMIRAQFYQHQKQSDLAWLDLRRALQKSPQDVDVVLANLWFLIDGQRTEWLTRYLKTYSPQASKNSAYWLAYAAAQQTLNQHAEAVHWYAKAVKLHADDPLVLLNYADALERMHRIGMAERIRRHAWLLLKSKYPNPPTSLSQGQSAELLAFSRLALLDQPGDPAFNRVRQLVSELRGVPNVQQDAQSLNLVLGWSILKEQFENARLWMWRRYTQQTFTAAPLWGQSQTALQLKDSQSMDHLLQTQSQDMPIYNRYDTAYALGHVQQALDIAFKGMSGQEDEALHDRFRQHAPLQAHYLELRTWADSQGSLDNHGLQFETRLAISSQLHLTIRAVRHLQSSSDPVLASLAPGTDRLGSIQASWLGARGTTLLTLFRREELDGLTGFKLSESYQWGGRLNLEGTLDFRNESTVSQALRVAGYENSVSGSANYVLGKREYLRVAPKFSNYYTQFGDYLGSGRSIDMEAGYRLRTEYPDWRLRSFVTHQRFSPDGSLSATTAVPLPMGWQTYLGAGVVDPVAYFIPQGSTTWGACLGMGENLSGQNLQTVYSRAWRPFTDVCLSRNSATGNGMNGSLGLAGSVTGEDHLQLLFQYSDGTAPGSTSTNVLSARYRHYF